MHQNGFYSQKVCFIVKHMFLDEERTEILFCFSGCFSNPTSPPRSPIGSVPCVPLNTLSSPSFKGVRTEILYRIEKFLQQRGCTTGAHWSHLRNEVFPVFIVPRASFLCEYIFSFLFEHFFSITKVLFKDNKYWLYTGKVKHGCICQRYWC